MPARLDARKRKVDALTSNPGHCWTGIVPAEHRSSR
jgi:hypothetical protein